MFTFYWIDRLPPWLFFIFLIVLFCLAAELGFRFGKYLRSNVKSARNIEPAGILGAVLALLAFIMAFTFNAANGRFQERKHLLLQETNALGTTYLRTDLLPDEQKEECQNLLREYVDIILKARSHTGQALEETVARVDSIHNELWLQAVSLKNDGSFSIAEGLFTESLNEVFDIATERINISFRARIPKSIWIALFSITFVSMLLRGYVDGVLGKDRAIFATLILIIAFSSVQLLIFDFDRSVAGEERLMKVNHQALIDLQQLMKNEQ